MRDANSRDRDETLVRLETASRPRPLPWIWTPSNSWFLGGLDPHESAPAHPLPRPQTAARSVEPFCTRTNAHTYTQTTLRVTSVAMDESILCMRGGLKTTTIFAKSIFNTVTLYRDRHFFVFSFFLFLPTPTAIAG